jgi:hypothetical protein
MLSKPYPRAPGKTLWLIKQRKKAPRMRMVWKLGFVKKGSTIQMETFFGWAMGEPFKP